ncbi:MAG: acyl--CoA ligase [Deltaproteobacteria bacterium]|nr:acyl--CoA ligase [Deltaproteobacteria bacterium]
MSEYRSFKDGMYEDIEKEVFNGVEMRHYKDRPNNLVELLNTSVDRFSGRTAVVDNDVRISYGEFHRLCRNLALSLTSLGINKGDRVAILMNNGWEYAVSYYGIIQTGAIAVLLNWRCSGSELEYMLDDSGAKYLLMGGEHWEKLESISKTKISLKGIYTTHDHVPGKTECFGDLLEPDFQHASVEFPSIHEADPAAIMYTSGTTGKPKGALQTHRNCVANAVNVCKVAEIDENDIQIILAPMFHASGMNAGLTTCLYAGGSSVIRPSFDPLDALTQIQEEKITVSGGVATMWWVILHMTPWSDFDLTSLNKIIFGGSPVPTELIQQLTTAFPNVRFGNIYGSTEATSTSSYNTHEDILRIPEAVGQPLPTIDIKIIDPVSGIPKPHGEVGEICVKGPTVCGGYWNRPQATQETS